VTKSPYFADFNLGNEPLPATARTFQQLLRAAAIAEIQNLFTIKGKTVGWLRNW